MASPADIFLYWGSGSSPCWRVQLLLEEKGLQGYKEKMISFSNKEHKSEEIMKINPRGQVPTFKHGDLVINESLAAIEFLERTYKGQGTSLVPEDPAAMALVLQRQFEALNIHKNCIEGVVYYQYMTKDIDQEALKTKKEALHKEIAIWEGYMAQLGDGNHIGGTAFSMADVVFFPPLAFLVRSGLILDEKYPSLAKYYNMVMERPSVKATWPPHWNEGPGKDLIN